jgi:hypothetical protein
MFLFRQTSGGMACCFLEMDTGAMNLKQIEAKFRRYTAWANSESAKTYLMGLYRAHGAADPQPHFRVLFVVDHRNGTRGKSRVRDLMRLALYSANGLRSRLWFTEVATLRDHQHDPLPLNAAIWRRAHDVRPEHMTRTVRRAPYGTRNPSVAIEALDRLPEYTLFPRSQAPEAASK